MPDISTYVERFRSVIEEIKKSSGTKVVGYRIGKPASSSTLVKAEKKLGASLPAGVKNLYGQANGLALMWTTTGQAPVRYPGTRSRLDWEYITSGVCQPVGLVFLPPLQQVFGKEKFLDYNYGGADEKDEQRVYGCTWNGEALADALFPFDLPGEYYSACFLVSPQDGLDVVVTSDSGANLTDSYVTTFEDYLEHLLERYFTLECRRGFMAKSTRSERELFDRTSVGDALTLAELAPPVTDAAPDPYAALRSAGKSTELESVLGALADAPSPTPDQIREILSRGETVNDVPLTDPMARLIARAGDVALPVLTEELQSFDAPPYEPTLRDDPETQKRHLRARLALAALALFEDNPRVTSVVAEFAERLDDKMLERVLEATEANTDAYAGPDYYFLEVFAPFAAAVIRGMLDPENEPPETVLRLATYSHAYFCGRNVAGWAIDALSSRGPAAIEAAVLQFAVALGSANDARRDSARQALGALAGDEDRVAVLLDAVDADHVSERKDSQAGLIVCAADLGGDAMRDRLVATIEKFESGGRRWLLGWEQLYCDTKARLDLS